MRQGESEGKIKSIRLYVVPLSEICWFTDVKHQLECRPITSILCNDVNPALYVLNCSFLTDKTDPPSWQGSPLAEQFCFDEPASTDPGHDRRRKQETRKKRRDEERREGRREVREDGGTVMAAGAISAEAAGTSLESTELYWVGAAWMSKSLR